MAQDKFKPVGPTFQIYKDGEAISARKLDGIIRGTQDAFDKLEKVVGDLENRELTFSGLPLFQNSIGRAIGPMDGLTIVPLRVFDIPQDLDSIGRGLVRFPYSSNNAVDVGNRSQNLLPLIGQTDKVGIGCVADDGMHCTRRFDKVYNEEKNLLVNGLFTDQLSGWNISGVLFDPDTIDACLDLKLRWNTLAYSEDFSQWTSLSGTLTARDTTDPNGTSNATGWEATNPGPDLVNLTRVGLAAETSPDWCFSIYLSASGVLPIFMEISGFQIEEASEAGGISVDKRLYSALISGSEWQRHYIHGMFDSAVSSGVAKLHLGIGNITTSDKLYLWGAQLEPTKYPSEYRATSGTLVSGFVGLVSLEQTIDTIPGKFYQAAVEWTSISGTGSWYLYANNELILSGTMNDDLSQHQVIRASDSETSFRLITSGNSNTSFDLNLFRVDPGMPCHALNCPGFSAFEKKRLYRAVLPNITFTGHQYFGNALKLPDEFDLSQVSELPTNVLGVFDHEQNHAVPDHLVDWALSNWPIGLVASVDQINDPMFLEDWDILGSDEFPGEFTPYTISGGTLARASLFANIQNFASGVSGLAPEAWWDADTLKVSGLTDLGNNITYVRDKTGNGHDLTDLGTPPTYWATNAYGHPAIGVQSSFKVMAISTSISRAASESYTVAGFYRPINSSAENCYLFGNSATAERMTIYRYPFHGGATTSVAVYTPSTRTFGSTVVPSGWNNDYHDFANWREVTVHKSELDGVDISALDVDGDSFSWNRFAEEAVGNPHNTLIAELMVFYRVLTSGERETIRNYFNEKYFGIVPISSGITATQVDLDILNIIVSGSSVKGIQKIFTLEDNKGYLWEYQIRGSGETHNNVLEKYEVLTGSAEVDLFLDNQYQVINSSGLDNTYMVEGTSSPGETEWSTFSNGFWNIDRRIKSTSSNTTIRLTLAAIGSGDLSILQVDGFDFKKISAASSIFEYDCAPVLGLNWEGTGEHVLEENLLGFSEGLLLWQTSGNATVSPGNRLNNGIRIHNANTAILHLVSGAHLLDSTFTLAFESVAPALSSGLVIISQVSGLTQNFNWSIPSEPSGTVLVFSGVVYEWGEPLEIKFHPYNAGVEVAHPQLVHGSGAQDYIPTYNDSIRTYRHQVRPSPLTVDTSWYPSYALVQGGLVSSTVKDLSVSDGTSWRLTDTRGFPEEGVIRIADQEYGYRLKTSGLLTDTIPNWRGTPSDPGAINSGTRVLNIPIPQSIIFIDPDTQILTFRDVIPAPAGDWANNLNLQIYNTRVQNIDRWSLQSSAVPITQAVGNLLTSFVGHVADHRRHLRLSQLCGLIIDPSSWAASPDIEAIAFAVNPEVTELTEELQLNVEAKRFVPTSDKEITINWGDGETTTRTGTGTIFNGNGHIYDLKQLTDPQAYTITVTITDLDLNFSRSTQVIVIVFPKLNAEGQPTKSSILAACKILLPGETTTLAGAKIKNQASTTTLAGAKITLP